MRAYVVIGAESSGTRFLTGCLISLGARGSAALRQPFDDELPRAGGRPIVWRRSFPYDRDITNMADIKDALEARGWSPYVLVIVRDFKPLIASQRLRQHIKREQNGLEIARRVYNVIFKGLLETGLPYEIVTYQGLVQYTGAMLRDLGHRLDGLTPPPAPAPSTAHDGDEKHWRNWSKEDLV